MFAPAGLIPRTPPLSRLPSRFQGDYTMFKLASALALVALASPALAQDAVASVVVRAAGNSVPGCFGPLEVHNLSASRGVRVTITKREDAGYYGSSTTSQAYPLGPSESAALGCATSSGPGSAHIARTFTIANATFTD